MGETHDSAPPIPRWARDLGEETWARIHELLEAAWDAPDVMRELNLPESKRRSLQLLARKYGPRRRLVLFSQFRDGLLRESWAMGPDMARALRLIVQLALSPNVKESTQIKAAEKLIEFIRVLGGVMKSDEAEERARIESGTEKRTVDVGEMLRQIGQVYGVNLDGAKA